jgi:hypothetical protein
VARWVLARSSSTHVAVRDPGGTLSDPIEIAGAQADGVAHPAIAVDAAGDVLLAYETGTAASHLHMQGAIAVAYRPAGSSSFIGPTVVDRVLSNPPVVALAQDGTGIVTWTRQRALMASTVGSDGAVGAARRIARRGTFGRAQTAFRGSSINRGVALAADEQARATLAWTGAALASRATASRIWTAAGRAGRPFGHPRMVAPRDESFDEAVSIAARNGHVALAWRELTAGTPTGVQVTAGSWNEALDPELTPSAPPAERPAVTVAGDGRTSAFWRTGKLWVSYGP